MNPTWDEPVTNGDWHGLGPNHKGQQEDGALAVVDRWRWRRPGGGRGGGRLGEETMEGNKYMKESEKKMDEANEKGESRGR